MYEVENLNQALITMSKAIVKEGKWRETRGVKCLEIPHPVLICITNPTDRYVTIEERKWNKILPWMESLWIGLGRNDMELPLRYVKNLGNYSDDGLFMRAGYGPRIRGYNNSYVDYAFNGKYDFGIDQLRYVIMSLQKDINTRQASITIHDPIKDDFGKDGKLKETKDTPCTRTIQFMVVDGKLDCTVTMRSNDVLWGFSAVNVFNFTLMQEYVSAIVGVPVGKYYHFANNLHVYEDKYELVKQISKLKEKDYVSKFGVWEYVNCGGNMFTSINGLDKCLEEVRDAELAIVAGEKYKKPSHVLGQDWVNMFEKHWNKEKEVTFHNLYLNGLYS